MNGKRPPNLIKLRFGKIQSKWELQKPRFDFHFNLNKATVSETLLPNKALLLPTVITRRISNPI